MDLDTKRAEKLRGISSLHVGSLPFPQLHVGYCKRKKSRPCSARKLWTCQCEKKIINSFSRESKQIT